MRRVTGLSALLALSLAACAAPLPPGPSVMALPGQGKSFEIFQQDDGVCRQFASAQIGDAVPGVAANQSFAGSAAIGTLLGAAAGAAIGAATGGAAAGAAIGAASGLFLGSATGFSAAGYSGAALQGRYDMSYVQCMSAKGEQVPTTLNSAGTYPYPYPYSYAYPYPNYFYYGYPYYRYSYWGYPYSYYPPPAVSASFIVGGVHGGHY
jgi:Glycine-zipper domain